MKKILSLLFVPLLLLSSCESGTRPLTASSEEVNEFVTEANFEIRVDGEYMFEITFGNESETTLYYAKGDIKWDRVMKIAYADFDQAYLAASERTENYFADGKMISVSGGEVIESERASEELLSKFPYVTVPEVANTLGDITVGASSVGTTYSFVRSDTKELSLLFVEEDIHELVHVLKKPRPELTEYSDMECVYTVSDGKLVSCRFEFDMKLFDTPAYIPGYSVPESEYTLDVHITAKITYDDFGSGVEIPEYSESVEASKGD